MASYQLVVSGDIIKLLSVHHVEKAIGKPSFLLYNKNRRYRPLSFLIAWLDGFFTI
jgi:hypothetical protein